MRDRLAGRLAEKATVTPARIAPCRRWRCSTASSGDESALAVVQPLCPDALQTVHACVQMYAAHVEVLRALTSFDQLHRDRGLEVERVAELLAHAAESGLCRRPLP